MLETALRNAGVYDPCCIITSMGEIGVPDIVGEMADLLLRDEETEWSLVYGFYDGQMLLSLRTADREGDAGRVIQRIVHGLGTGGGHRAMAGGQVRISNDSAEGRKEAEEIVRKRFLRSIRLLNKPGEKLTARRKQGKEE
ncbi:DHH family phosphoesterase, partial [bacterium]|nr:DHH family phosphoesterase [bacterium]